MTASKPNQLKVFREQTPEGAEPDIQKVASLPRLLAAFREATGWSLEYHCGPKPTHRTEHAWSAPVNPGVGASPGHVRLDLVRSASAVSELPGTRGEGRGARDEPSRTTDPSSLIPHPSSLAPPVELPRGVRKLATAVAEMLGEFQRTRRALWQREAELAAGVPVVVRSGDEMHLAARLQAVLRGGAEAVGCHAAALYLLDDATSHLKLRSSWGLPPERLTDPPRQLQGALADLEAMLGHAVVLEDTGLLPNWNAPEEFPCAACVPVATASTILGTLWVFCQSRRDFNDRETNILEVVAGRLAADLQREMLLQESMQGAKFQKELASAERTQRGQLPAIAPLLDGWDVAGWIPQTGAPLGEFFDWFSMPEGLIAVVAGSVAARGLEGALTASTLRGALRSHAQYHRAPDTLLHQVNLTLWTASAGDQAASLFCGLIDSREGLFRYALAGNPSVLLFQPDGWKSLTDPKPPLGTAPESECGEGGCPMQAGEVILAFTLKGRRGEQVAGAGSEKVTGTFCRNGPEGASHKRCLSPFPAGAGDAEALLAEAIKGHLDLSAKDLLALARETFQSHPGDAPCQLGAALVVKRRNS